MRISDWSSDVCASELATLRRWAGRGSQPRDRPARIREICRLARCGGGERHGAALGRGLFPPFVLSLSKHRSFQGTQGRKMRTALRSEEHTSELQSLMRISYAVFCLKKKQKKTTTSNTNKR